MVEDPFAEDDSPDSHDPFALAGNEIRMAIIRELGEAQGTRGPPAVLSFAELRGRVGPQMDSSRFNYHLQQLVDHFVVSADDGYRLRPEGTTLYRTLRAGAFAQHRSIPSVDIDCQCHFCEGSLEALYDDGRFTVRCGECEHIYNRQTIPPHAFEDGLSESVIRRCDQFHRHQLLASSRGVCPICVGALDTQLIPASEVVMPGETTDDLTVFAHASCGHCGHQHYMSVGSVLLYHPLLVSFLHERGVDVTAEPVWELEFAATDRAVDVRSRDPWEVALVVRYEGDELELVIDEDFTLVDHALRES